MTDHVDRRAPDERAVATSVAGDAAIASGDAAEHDVAEHDVAFKNGDDGCDNTDIAGSSAGRVGATRLVLHALAALAAITVLVVAMHGRTPVISDDGSVLAQAALMGDGRMGTELPLGEADPDGVFPPLENSTVADGRAYPYVKHLALPAAVMALTTLFGGVGGVLLSAWTVWLAGVAAAVLARRIDPKLAPLALWSTVFLSPLVFDANLVVSTGAAAAATGFLVAAILAVRERPRWWRLVPIVPLAFMVPLWRTEGMFAIAAVAVLASTEPVVRALRARRMETGTVVRAAAGVVAGVAGIAGYALDLRMAARAIGGSSRAFVPSTEGYEPFRGRMAAVWTSLLSPSHDAPEWTSAVVLVVLVLVIGAAVLARRGAPGRSVVVALSLAAAASLLLAVAPADLITGLVPAVPLVFAGLLLLRSSDLRDDAVRSCLGVAALTAFGVIATSYTAGGGAEWGGRYFHIVLPLLVPPALLGLRAGRERLDGHSALAATVAVGILAAAPTGLALRSVADLHRGSERTVQVVLQQLAIAERAMADEPGGPSGDGGDLVVVSARPTFGRFAWDRLDGIRLLSVADPTRLDVALDGVTVTDVQRLVVLAQDDEEPTGDTLGQWRVLGRNEIGGWQFTRMERLPDAD